VVSRHGRDLVTTWSQWLGPDTLGDLPPLPATELLMSNISKVCFISSVQIPFLISRSLFHFPQQLTMAFKPPLLLENLLLSFGTRSHFDASKAVCKALSQISAICLPDNPEYVAFSSRFIHPFGRCLELFDPTDLRPQDDEPIVELILGHWQMVILWIDRVSSAFQKLDESEQNPNFGQAMHAFYGDAELILANVFLRSGTSTAPVVPGCADTVTRLWFWSVSESPTEYTIHLTNLAQLLGDSVLDWIFTVRKWEQTASGYVKIARFVGQSSTINSLLIFLRFTQYAALECEPTVHQCLIAHGFMAPFTDTFYQSLPTMDTPVDDMEVHWFMTTAFCNILVKFLSVNGPETIPRTGRYLIPCIWHLLKLEALRLGCPRM
jgi:hypothetical protein